MKINLKLFFVLLFFSQNVYSHHSFMAIFDLNSPVKLKGKVIKVEWINPHAWIHIKTTDKKKQVWKIEMGTPNSLTRRGISKKDLPIGSEVIIAGHQTKGRHCDPDCIANGKSIKFLDGRTVFLKQTKEK